MAWNSSSVILSPERKDLSAVTGKILLGKQFKKINYLASNSNRNAIIFKK